HSKEHFGLRIRIPKNNIEDFVQDVYVKITQNNLKALREFEGKAEESIFAYLNVIAHNVVKNHVESLKAKKRSVITVPIDEDNSDTKRTDSPQLIERLKSFLFDTELIIEYSFLKEEIENHLRKNSKGANLERDIFLFTLAVFEDLTAEEIAYYFPCDLTAKRIGNIVANLKQDVRSELLKRFSLRK
ncbi:MAG: RNA polymerase sigma factor, partial [bacterium]